MQSVAHKPLMLDTEYKLTQELFKFFFFFPQVGYFQEQTVSDKRFIWLYESNSIWGQL